METKSLPGIQQYAFAYMNAKLAGRPDLEAHNIARRVADAGAGPYSGTAQFKLFLMR